MCKSPRNGNINNIPAPLLKKESKKPSINKIKTKTYEFIVTSYLYSKNMV